MGLWTVHKHGVNVKYKAPVCSKATLFVLLCGFLLLFIPLIIVYRTQDFWKKFDFYREQPTVHFKNKVIIVIEGRDSCKFEESEIDEDETSAPTTTSILCQTLAVSTDDETTLISPNISSTVSSLSSTTDNGSSQKTKQKREVERNGENTTVFDNTTTETSTVTTVSLRTLEASPATSKVEDNVTQSAGNLTSGIESDNLTTQAFSTKEETGTVTNDTKESEQENCYASFAYLTWSTDFLYNHLNQDNLRSTLLKSYEEDINRDGKKDMLKFTISMPLKITEEIYSVKLLLFFDYKLKVVAHQHLEGIAYIEYSSGLPGRSMTVIGDLLLKQQSVFRHIDRSIQYLMPVLPEDSMNVKDYDIANILKSYSLRNVSTQLRNVYYVWTSGKESSFVIDGSISYPEDLIKYTPSFWNQLKWAWIQYLAIIIVFFGIIHCVKTFMFKNNILPSLLISPWKEHHP